MSITPASADIEDRTFTDVCELLEVTQGIEMTGSVPGRNTSMYKV